MDPEVVLDKLREAAAEYRKWSGHACDQQALDEADKMADHFEALDRWLSQGGFLPEAWRKGGPGGRPVGKLDPNSNTSRVLGYVRRFPDCRICDLIQALPDIPIGSISTSLGRLARNGFIKRAQGKGSRGKRNWHYVATDKS